MSPEVHELWEEAAGNHERFVALMRQHGLIVLGSPYCVTCRHHQRDHHYSDEHEWCRPDCDCGMWLGEPAPTPEPAP